MILFLSLHILSDFKWVDSLSGYSQMTVGGSTEKRVLGRVIQVSVHFVRERLEI